MSHDNRGRNWSDATTSYHMPRIASHYKAIGGNKEGLPPSDFKGNLGCQQLDFSLLASKTCVILKYPI
jgi:hypothetical protein